MILPTVKTKTDQKVLMSYTKYKDKEFSFKVF